MDPDENLREQLETATKILDGPDATERELRLAELVVSLDEYIQRGGFLPGRWQRRE